jgi:glycosyltransferase involved in cell wall biosynthesis
VKILWVKPGKLLPIDTGGKLRSYNILRHLIKTHDVTYLSYYSGPRDDDYEREISHRLPGALPICGAMPVASGVGRYIDYSLRLPIATPYAVSRFASSRVRRIIAQLMAQGHFDVAVCDFLASAASFPRKLTIPTVLFQHNVESVLWRRRVRFAAGSLDRIITRIEYAKMARYEPAQVKRFHRVLAVSEKDRQAMSEMAAPLRISVIPTGVDLTEYFCEPESQMKSPLVVFVGSMDWEPNVDGVEYFCRDIWPRVLETVPDAHFRIVGRNPTPRVRKLACDSIEVTGTVPSTVKHLREAAVVVVPLRIGGGTRLKIYEGMAMGKATVSTSVGAEGLDVCHNHDILLADTPEQFAGHVIRALRDQDFRRRFETAAANSMKRHDWSAISERFTEELEAARAEPVRQASVNSWQTFAVSRSPRVTARESR